MRHLAVSRQLPRRPQNRQPLKQEQRAPNLLRIKCGENSEWNAAAPGTAAEPAWLVVASWTIRTKHHQHDRPAESLGGLCGSDG